MTFFDVEFTILYGSPNDFNLIFDYLVYLLKYIVFNFDKPVLYFTKPVLHQIFKFVFNFHVRLLTSSVVYYLQRRRGRNLGCQSIK